MRRPATPSASSRSSTSAIDSEAGDQLSVSPAARTAPRTFGPRASTSTPPRHRSRSLAEAPALGRLDPAAEADRRRGDDGVRAMLGQRLGGVEEFGVVGQRDDAQRRRVQHLGAAPLQQGAQLLGPPCGRDPDGESGEGLDLPAPLSSPRPCRCMSVSLRPCSYEGPSLSTEHDRPGSPGFPCCYAAGPPGASHAGVRGALVRSRRRRGGGATALRGRPGGAPQVHGPGHRAARSVEDEEGRGTPPSPSPPSQTTGGRRD